MARIARVIAPGLLHHVTQRGNRRQTTFFCEEDYQIYIDLMSHWCAKYHVDIWAWCLMPNHVHLIAVPTDETGFPGTQYQNLMQPIMDLPLLFNAKGDCQTINIMSPEYLNETEWLCYHI